MMRVAIVAALPGELRRLVRDWQRERRDGVDVWRWRFDQGEWVAACAGAGVEAATRALAEVEKDGHVDSVVSTGWAGALGEEFLPGQAYFVSGVIDARTGERFEAKVSSHPAIRTGADEDVHATAGREAGATQQQRAQGHPELWLVTSPRVADAEEKRRLAGAYGAGLVDMEAAGVARLAAARRIPFYCVKAVSDGYREQLPDFNRFISATGQFHLLRFILFVILRPWYWPALVRMGENSRKAAQAIRESLLEILDETGAVRRRNGYPSFER
jgi:adenosylhomocysteine nucleosidase